MAKLQNDASTLTLIKRALPDSMVLNIPNDNASEYHICPRPGVLIELIRYDTEGQCDFTIRKYVIEVKQASYETKSSWLFSGKATDVNFIVDLLKNWEYVG